ncbi:MAG TPA: SDR family oxidoreductase [Thermoanaerobaculia bacterium]|nr:SDR family oxidoreductase [Thermoanaerobaculia bacterium]
MAEQGQPRGRKTALLTGASSGIGSELTSVFAAGGFDLVLVARSAGRLEQLAGELRSRHGVGVRVLAKDLAVAAAAREVWQELGEAGTQIDVLVNNAGFGTYGPFAETDLNAELQEMQLNMVTPTELTKHFLPGMLARRWGRILNVASTAAFQPGPLMAVYYATKAYLLWFSEALAEELAGTGVTVTALCPGPTSSGFQARAAMEESKLFAGKNLMTAAAVARAGYDGLLAGRRIVIPGLMNRLLAQSARVSPRRLVTRIVRRMQERKGGH